MKYYRTFLLSLQSEFLSRANIFGWFLVGSLPSVIFILVWFAILGERQSINGFTRGDFIIYYIFVTIGWYIVGGSFKRQIGYGIKGGIINTTLLKPYDVVLGKCIEEQAWKVLSIIVALPATALILYLFRDLITFQLSLAQVLWLIPSLVFGAINFALFEAIIGLTAFWITEIWPAAELGTIVVDLFSGRYVPLSLMPPAIFFLANILPFKYMFYVPISILLSKSANPLLEIGIQLLYVGILFSVYRFIWARGLKEYEGVGI